MREILLHADDTENKVLICLPEIFEIFKGSFLQMKIQKNFGNKFWMIMADFPRDLSGQKIWFNLDFKTLH